MLIKDKEDKKMKLWKVRVNNFGWNSTRTFFAASRKACEEIANKFPASDDVEYAGNFSETNAKELLSETKAEFDAIYCGW